VFERLALSGQMSGLREEKSRDCGVAPVLRYLQVEVPVHVAHGEHAVEQVSAVRPFRDLRAHLLVKLVVDLADDLFE
jgi:hypothetical protein